MFSRRVSITNCRPYLSDWSFSFWRFDFNLVKRVRIGEGKEFEFWADAINLLNRTNFATPNTDINSTNFGRITETIGGNRIIVLNARINF
jgi:hypothetical protein